MNTFLQRALTILMTIIFLVAVLRVSTFSNFEEDEVEENIEKLADIDDEESFYYFQWNLNLLEIKRQKQEKTEFKTAFKNRLNYLNPYIDKILIPPELLV